MAVLGTVKGLTTSPSGQSILPPSAKSDLAADVVNPASTAGAAVSRAVMNGTGAELRHNFRGLPDGPVPASFDTGQALTYTATTPVIRGGAFTTPTTSTARTATYLEPVLSGKLTRVGAEFIIRRDTAEQADGALAMGAWSDPGVVSSYPNGFPVAGAHFVINRNRWYYNFYADVDSTNVAGADFKTPLPEGVPHRVELAFNGPRVVVSLPDGSSVTFTDPRADQHVDSRPFWEPFMERGSGDTNIGITQVWADSAETTSSPNRFATAHELTVRLASRPAATYSTQWKPATEQYKNLPDSSAPAVIHPDLYVDFPLPESRRFVITASASMEKAGASTPYWMFTGNTSMTLGVLKLSGLTGIETITGQLFVDLSTNGSFKAGNTVRIGWSYYKAGTDRVTLQARNGAWPTLTATPVNGRVVTSV